MPFPNSAAKLQPLAHLQYEKSDILSLLTLHFALTPPTEKFRPLRRILSDIISLPTAAVIITVGMSFRPQPYQTFSLLYQSALYAALTPSRQTSPIPLTNTTKNN